MLNGEESTLWVKRAGQQRFIKARRSQHGDAAAKGSGPINDRYFQCETHFLTDSYWNCYGVNNERGNILGEVACEISYRESGYQFCYDDEETETDWLSGGGAGGGPEQDPPQPDPCATAQAQTATSLAGETVFNSAKSEIQAAAASSNKEHGVSFGKDANGNLIKSAMNTGTESSGTTPSVTNKLADIHNHPDNSPPSPGDIYAFIDGMINQPNFTTRYVIASGGDVYALVVTDRQAAINFNGNYPRIRFKDEDGNLLPPDFPEEIHDKIQDVKDYLFLNGNYSNLQRDESSLAVVLQQYNTGLSLLKMNPEGSFKKIKTNEETTGGSPTYIINNCL